MACYTVYIDVNVGQNIGVLKGYERIQNRNWHSFFVSAGIFWDCSISSQIPHSRATGHDLVSLKEPFGSLQTLRLVFTLFRPVLDKRPQDA